MKKHRFITAILAIILILNYTLISVSAASNSGTCGPNATWSYNEQTRTLTISGFGAIDGYEQLAAINGSLGKTAPAP